MDAQWLKENVGVALSHAMLDLAKNQPEDPIDFLGKHLLHNVKRKKSDMRKAELGMKVQIREIEAEREAKAAAATEAERFAVAKAVDNAKATALEELCTVHQVEFNEDVHGDASDIGVADQLGVLSQDKVHEMVQLVAELSSAHSIYVGRRNTDGSVTFISSTDPTLVGKSLTDDVDEDGNSTVLPFAVFTSVPESEEETTEKSVEEGSEGTEGADGADGAESKEESLPQYVSVPNVLRDARVPFFDRVPVLGSFLAVHVPYKQSIHGDAIPEDGGLIVEEEVENIIAERAEGAEGAEDAEDAEEAEGAGGAEVAEGAEGAEGTEGTEVEEGEAAEGEAAEDGDELELEQSNVKRWRANQVDASLVVCLDTIGGSSFSTNGLSEDEIVFVRSLCGSLGKALTEIEDIRFQEEMQQRERLTEMGIECKATLKADLTELEPEVEAKRAKYTQKMEAAAALAAEATAHEEAAADEKKPTNDEERANSEEGVKDKDGATTEAGASPISVPAEPPTEQEIAFNNAKIGFELVKDRLCAAPWWVTQIRAWRKLCIVPPAEELTAFTMCLRVFSPEDACVNEWDKIKQMNLDELAINVRNFTVSTENCPEDPADALATLVELAAVEGTFSEESPAWCKVLLVASKHALETSVAATALSTHIHEVEEARLAAEATAAADTETEAETTAAESEE